MDRVCDAAGYAAGNSDAQCAGQSRQGGPGLGRRCGAHQAASQTDGCVHGLDAAAWMRVAVLISFVTPLTHEQAARPPLRVLPPNRLRLLNPCRGCGRW